MKLETLKKHVEKMGSRVKFRSTRLYEKSPIVIDVRRDKEGEYYDIAFGERAPRLELLQSKPKDRHMLLYADDGKRYLFGHDERHWFVAGINDSVSTILAARQSLMPAEIKRQVSQFPPDEVDNRKNIVFKRQGEWFFIPSNKKIDAQLILRNEPLRRSMRHKPHTCQELYREGGQQVYIVGKEEYTTVEYEKEKKKDPNFDKGRMVRTMTRNPHVYVQGYIKHSDHKTLKLSEWHRVLINAEFTSSSVTFLD